MSAVMAEYVDYRELEATLYCWGQWANREGDGTRQLRVKCITGIIDRNNNGVIIRASDAFQRFDDEEGQRVERFINLLSPKQRSLVKKRYIGRLSYEDLAIILHKSPGTAWRWYRDILDTLYKMGLR